MTSKSVLLAVEDAPGAAVATRLLADQRVDVAQVVGMRGNAYLRSKAAAFNRTATGFPVFMLTDLDNPKCCPSDLIAKWVVGRKHEDFLLRIAVVEVEAWIMADRYAFADFIRVPAGRVPAKPDDVPDPKQFLVNLARKSSSSKLRQDMVPADGSTAPVGPAYNPTITGFVRQRWCPSRAAESSPSLRRTIERVAAFAAR